MYCYNKCSNKSSNCPHDHIPFNVKGNATRPAQAKAAIPAPPVYRLIHYSTSVHFCYLSYHITFILDHIICHIRSYYLSIICENCENVKILYNICLNIENCQAKAAVPRHLCIGGCIIQQAYISVPDSADIFS